MKSNIIIRADSSSSIGTGHIMRDLVLAKQFKDSNIIFATQNLEGNINYKIIEDGYRLETLKSNSIDELDTLIKKYNIDMLVIDHYGIDYNFEKELKTKNPKLKIMALDDTYERHYCDILINHNISGDAKKYKGLVPSYCELRCGAEYTLIRDEFYKAKRLKRVFVAMGGTDYGNLNISILKVLEEFKDIEAVVVSTVANPHLEKLKEFARNREWIDLHINSNSIAKLMKISDFAIVTPSVTVNEVYFMELPLIAITVAPNQKDMAEFLKNKGYLVIDNFTKKALELSIEKILKPKLINFIDLSLEEKKMVLEWRNHSSIRKFMRNKEIIPLENHLKYIEFLKNSKDKKYFLVKELNEYVGTIDFTEIDLDKKETHLGLYAKPNLRGVGDILMNSIIDYAFNSLGTKVLKLEVLKDNIKAIKLYKRFGFSIVGEDNVYIFMELKYENR